MNLLEDFTVEQISRSTSERGIHMSFTLANASLIAMALNLVACILDDDTDTDQSIARFKEQVGYKNLITPLAETSNVFLQGVINESMRIKKEETSVDSDSRE